MKAAARLIRLVRKFALSSLTVEGSSLKSQHSDTMCFSIFVLTWSRTMEMNDEPKMSSAMFLTRERVVNSVNVAGGSTFEVVNSSFTARHTRPTSMTWPMWQAWVFTMVLLTSVLLFYMTLTRSTLQVFLLKRRSATSGNTMLMGTTKNYMRMVSAKN